MKFNEANKQPPRRIWYLVALAIFILLPAIGASLLVKDVTAIWHGGMQFVAPGSTTIHIKKTGEYTLWREGHKNLPNSSIITVRELNSGRLIHIQPGKGWKLSSNSKTHTAVAYINFNQQGLYQISVTGQFPDKQFRLQQPIFHDLIFSMLKGVLLILLGLIAGPIIALVVFIKRSNALAVAQPITEPHVITQTTEEHGRVWAAFCHLSSFMGFFIPLANIITPLIIWLIKKNDNPFINDQGKESINFQISIIIYYFLAAVLVLLLVGLLLLPLLLLFNVIAVIIATIEAGRGRYFRYPLSIRFIK